MFEFNATLSTAVDSKEKPRTAKHLTSDVRRDGPRSCWFDTTCQNAFLGERYQGSDI